MEFTIYICSCIIKWEQSNNYMVVISAFWLSKQFFEACAMIALVQVSVKVIKICMKSVSSKSVCNYLVFPGLSSLLQHPSPSAGDSIQSQILKRGVVQGKMSAKEDLKSSCHICLPLGLNVFFVKKDFKNKIWLWGVSLILWHLGSGKSLKSHN